MFSQNEAIIMNDIANHVLKSIQSIKEENGLHNFKPRAPICDPDAQPWRYGVMLQNAMLTVRKYSSVVLCMDVKTGLHSNLPCLDVIYELLACAS